MAFASVRKEPCRKRSRRKARALKLFCVSWRKFSLSAFPFLEVGGIEWFRKEILHLPDFHFAFEVRRDHGNIAAKFPDQLAASATGRRQRVGVSYHRNGIEAALTFADGLEDGDALSADGEAISCIFNVATAKDSAGRSAKRGTHAKI